MMHFGNGEMENCKRRRQKVDDPNYTGWWQRHMRVNNLPRVVTWQWNGRESNQRPRDH